MMYEELIIKVQVQPIILFDIANGLIIHNFHKWLWMEMFEIHKTLPNKRATNCL